MEGLLGNFNLPYSSLQEMIYAAVTIMIAFSVHEFSHAIVAYKFGDETAKNQGRLTLNPISHLDLLGTIFIFIAGFGWARPVPVNRFFFKKPRLAGILVSVAGPISNLLLATLGFIILFVLLGTGFGAGVSGMIDFFEIFIGLNIMLFVFNLLPFPPLDGYRIVEDLVPKGIRPILTQYESWGAFIFLVLVITPLYDFTLSPILNGVVPAIGDWLGTVLSQLFL